MKFFTRPFAALVLVSALSSPAFAAEEKKENFSKWDLGKVAFGEKVGRKDVKGKVVVLEYWGVNCPPCIASLPHLAELDRKHRAEGLVIIGAESQGSTKDEMKPVLEKAKVDYTIVEGAEGPIEVTGLPRVFIFGADGQLAFDGRPSGAEFDKAVADALAAAKGSGSGSGAAAATTGNLIPEQEWKNATGGSIRAAVKSADDKKVVFVMTNGKNVDYPLEKLSEESRKAVAEALAKAKSAE